MYIISLTTIPKRKDMFLKTLPYILQQKYAEKICINLDNNLSDEDYEFYDKIKDQDSRIEINKECDPKWRSANKLLPTIKKYPNDVIITMDDDLSYDKDCVKELVEMYERFSDCIIAHEINPVVCKDGKLIYIDDMDIKLKQKEYGKYLSHSCLFPPHTFDDTDVFDYDKMMKLTGGTHDELWFWEQSVLKGIKVIGLDLTLTMVIDSEIKHGENEYQLTNINNKPEKVAEYNRLFNEEYHDKIMNLLNNKNTYIEFFVNRSNVLTYMFAMQYLKNLYDGFKLRFYLLDDLKKSHICFLQSYMKRYGINNAEMYLLRS